MSGEKMCVSGLGPAPTRGEGPGEDGTGFCGIEARHCLCVVGFLGGKNCAE